MANINIDVDLEEFDLDDILDEIEDRYTTTYRRTHKDNKDKIDAFIAKMNIDVLESEPIRYMSITDKMKYDYFLNNIHRISFTDLENLTETRHN